MNYRIHESPMTGTASRTFRLDAAGAHPDLLTHVFVSVDCADSECGVHVLRFDRDAFTEMVKRELRLVEAEASTFALTADDLALLGNDD